MYGVLPTIPISELRTKQPEVIDGLRQSPIVLTRQGHSAGVIVHPRTWNYMVEVYTKAQQAGLLDIEESQLVELEMEMA